MKSNVILMVGIPGSGKSKLAKYLSKSLDCEILNRDLIRNKIFPKKFINHSNLQNDIASETLYKVLEYIIDLMGPDKIALGSDYPFPLGELNPGELIKSQNFSKHTKELLLNQSALNWLGMKKEDFL